MSKYKDVRIMLKEMSVVALFTALFAVSGYLYIPLTVPVTLQTFVLSMCLCCFGTSITLKMLSVYTLAGCIGIPVFSSFRGGISVLLQPTGGYIIGFFLMTLCFGLLKKSLPDFKLKNLVSLTLSLLPLYICGSIWYAFVYLNGTDGGLVSVLGVCVLPFVLPDIIKVTVASMCYEKLKRHIKNDIAK